MTDEERQEPSDHSLGLAAQAWCEPETSHKIMDEALCAAFARILDRALAQSDVEPHCPRCSSPDPARHPAIQFEGEVQICPHPFHGAQSDAEPAAWLLKSDDGRLTAFTTTNEDHARDYSQKHPHYSVFPLYTAPLRSDKSAWLANEAAALAQSDAEPVCKICGGSGYTRHLGRDNSEEVEDCSCQSSTQPRPDASAGLIEAGPVGWQYRNPLGDGTWHLTKDSGLGRFYMNNPDFECEPLYTAAQSNAARDYIEAEIKVPDPYDTEQPSKGQGWE